MRYESFAYLFPPRPDQAISPTMLPMVERQGYIAQVKKNGTCNVIAVSPTGEVKCMSRHKEDHKAWKPDQSKLKAFSRLAGRGWYVFVAELMHSKVAGIRDINYVHDILVHNGDYLVGKTQGQRQALLREVFPTAGLPETHSHYVYDEYTWIAKEYHEGFFGLYKGLDDGQDEGLVMKNPKQPLAFCTREKSNNVGLLKARKTHKNYSF